MQMIESADRRKAVGQLLAVAALMAVSYLCTSTLGFTNARLDLAFQRTYILWPFLAIRPALRLRGRPKVMTWILLAPLLAFSCFGLLITVISDIPAIEGKRQLSRELSAVLQGSYSVHLLWQETRGGAVGPHGVSLEQRMFILHGFYVVKYLDYFEGAKDGSLSAEGTTKVRLHIPDSGYGYHERPQEVDRVYSLKPRVYF
jgi:hypothetical protein